jgi:small GTP-binding protein
MLLYGSETIPITSPSEITSKTPTAKTETLREIIEKSTPVEEIAQKELNILIVGRTGAGKSSLINTLFQADLAQVDVLPSTDEIKSYQWKTPDGESLVLWDTPGYEQVQGKNYTEEVINYGQSADLILMVNPALDPSLQMDRDFLNQIRQFSDLPTIIVVTQVDRLRPIREWNPPYDWQTGNKPKEIAIQKAIAYRQEVLGDYGLQILPLVTADSTSNRISWGVHELSLAIMGAVSPAKELRLARFLRDRNARVIACAKVIDKYTFQMSSTQGLTSLLKSPILSFISTLSTGSPELGILLAQQIPIEQLPVVIGKLQMAYDLFQLLNDFATKSLKFELISLWSLLSDNSASPQISAWALGNSLVEYWSKNLSKEELEKKYAEYINKSAEKP